MQIVNGLNTRRFINPRGELVAIHSEHARVVLYATIRACLVTGRAVYDGGPRHYWQDELREIPRGDLHRYI